MQRQAMNPLGGINSIGNPPDHVQILEKELASLKSELQVGAVCFNFFSFI